MFNQFLGIDHVQLAAPPHNESLAKAFYSDKLGFKEIAKPSNLAKNGGVWFQVGDQQLHIGVQNASDIRKELEAKEIEIIYGDELEGANRFYIYDPFGNRIEIIEWL